VIVTGCAANLNAAQFDDAADLAAYPRAAEADLEVAAAAGADVVFAPAATEMYPPGFQTWVEVEELSRVLEGEHRPGHPSPPNVAESVSRNARGAPAAKCRSGTSVGSGAL